MKHKTLLFLSALILVLTIGCKSEVDQRNQAIFDYYKKDAQTFTLSPGENTLLGKEGTKLKIDANDLVTADGKAISGDVEVQLTEFYQTEDIILGNLSTSSNNKLLETGGMLNLSATADGREVVVKKGKEFKIEFSSAAKEGMELFLAEEVNGQLNWIPKSKPAPVSEFGFFARGDSEQNGVRNTTVRTVANAASQGVSRAWQAGTLQEPIVAMGKVGNNVLASSNFGWINCDRFARADNLTKIKINYDADFQPHTFLVFHEINSIMLSMFKNNQTQFINIPIGQEVTLFAFCIEEEQTYFSSKKIVVEDGMEVNIDFEEVPIDEIKASIKKFSK